MPHRSFAPPPIRPDTNVLFGVSVGDEPMEEVRITVLATGFERQRRAARTPEAAEAALPSVTAPTDADLEVPTFLRGRN